MLGGTSLITLIDRTNFLLMSFYVIDLLTFNEADILVRLHTKAFVRSKNCIKYTIHASLLTKDEFTKQNMQLDFIIPLVSRHKT